MARYIDKDTLIHDMCAGLCHANDHCQEWCHTLTVINMQPVIDVQPVRHGRWVMPVYGGSYCSECNMGRSGSGWRIYCSNCGARMDGVDNG